MPFTVIIVTTKKNILSSKPVLLLVMGHGLLNFCVVTKGRVCLWGLTARSHLAPLSLSFVFQDLFNKTLKSGALRGKKRAAN